MASMEVKSFDSPDEVREFEGKGSANVVQIGGRTVGRGTFEPGWKWSSNVKPIVRLRKTDRLTLPDSIILVLPKTLHDPSCPAATVG